MKEIVSVNQPFVDEKSIVRKIWGKSDTILFIFAGASAEFALNKAVDWLYFTGNLPSDPLSRLFSTVSYSRKIVFSSMEDTYKAIDTLRQIHGSVEANRGSAIPDWAYRDVLFLLIHYSIAAFKLLERKMLNAEKEEVYNVFFRVGDRMGLKNLPTNYLDWLPVRESHMKEDLQKSELTVDLFKQYKKHLGAQRYSILLEGQKLVVPNRVKQLLGFNNFNLLKLAIPVYKLLRLLKSDWLLKKLLIPSEFKSRIDELDYQPT